MKPKTMALGAWVFQFTMMTIIFVGSGLVGCRGSPEVMLVIPIGLPFILIDVQKHQWQAFGLAGLNLMLYVGLQYVDFQMVYWEGEQADMIVPIVRISSVLTVMGILVSQFWHLVSVSTRYMNRLQATTEDLRRQARVKEEFLAHISHELRTPLNAINGLSSIIMRDPDGPNQKRLATIANSGKHMLGLINNILDYSKLTASGFEFNGEPIALNEFASNLETAFKALAQEKGIDFEVILKTDLDGVVVDDNRINCMVMQQYLSLQGMKVDIAEDGEQALTMVDAQTFDLILMDLRMPGIDGFETSHIIRKRGIKTPIIALSASQYHEIKERLESNGINDFQSKPFEPAELTAKLRQYLQAG